MHPSDMACLRSPEWRFDQSGVALVSALMIMAALFILGLSSMQTTTIERRIAGNYKQSTQTFYAAEAGVTHVMAKLITSTEAFLAKPTAADLGLPDTKPAQFNLTNNFSYWVSNIRYDPSDPASWVEIQGSGAVQGSLALSQVEVRIEFDTASYFFDNGIFADQQVDIGGTGDIDSYDSCDGPYDPDNPGSNATVGVNSTGSDSITMQPQAVIHGDAYVGPQGDPDADINGGTVTGTTSATQQPKPLYPVIDPGGGGTPQPLTITGSDSKTFNSGAYRLSEITLNSNAEVLINGDVTLYVDGPINIGGLAQITINKGASLKLYASGDIDLGGRSIVNLTNQPKKNLLFGTASVNEIRLHGGAEFYGGIYAPNSDIIGVGNSEFFGSVVGKTIRTEGTAMIHQDECMGKGKGGGVRDLFKVAFWHRG